MQNASNRKKNAVYILKAAVAAALISLVIGLNYFTGTENWTAEQYAYFYTYLAGNTFVLYGQSRCFFGFVVGIGTSHGRYLRISAVSDAP